MNLLDMDLSLGQLCSTQGCRCSAGQWLDGISGAMNTQSDIFRPITSSLCTGTYLFLAPLRNVNFSVVDNTLSDKINNFRVCYLYEIAAIVIHACCHICPHPPAAHNLQSYSFLGIASTREKVRWICIFEFLLRHPLSHTPSGARWLHKRVLR